MTPKEVDALPEAKGLRQEYREIHYGDPEFPDHLKIGDVFRKAVITKGNAMTTTGSDYFCCHDSQGRAYCTGSINGVKHKMRHPTNEFDLAQEKTCA